MPFINLASLNFRPISILRVSGISDKIADISEIFPQPLFRRSSIVSRRLPVDDMISPRYRWDLTTFIFDVWTLSVGHGIIHLFSLPIWSTTLFSFDRVSLCVSMKEFITAFFLTEEVPHFEIARLSSTIPRTPISISGSPRNLYVRSFCFKIFLFSMSILDVHFKLPHTVPCISTDFTGKRWVIPLLILTATLAFEFSM